MSSTHRKKIARALATATGLTYQQALTRVIEADEAGLLPHALTTAGIIEAVQMLTQYVGLVTTNPDGRPFHESDREQVRIGLRRVTAMMRLSVPRARWFADTAETMTGEARLVFERIALAVPTGSVHAAMANEPHAFATWALSIVHAGETGGQLDAAFAQIADVF